MPDYFLGLMSGTSVDGIDAVLADLGSGSPNLVQTHSLAWPVALRDQIISISRRGQGTSLHEIGTLDAAIGEQFAIAVLETIDMSGIDAGQVAAIGSHGQTVYHEPGGTPAFSMQLGDPNRIAERTGITTVADFRRRDMAAGGQGAPLVPAFHRAVFHSEDESRAILNIGGMANLTLLPSDNNAVTGFDTGPGNALMDAWHQRHKGNRFDDSGNWAASGELLPDLLAQLQQHPFFHAAPPKSTGRDAFSIEWVDSVIGHGDGDVSSADVQRTLLELTAGTISDALLHSGFTAERLLVCGGGAHNRFLMARLQQLLARSRVETTESRGVHPDWVEALAFAWLAKQTLEHQPGNLPDVTGATHPVILGAVYAGS